MLAICWRVLRRNSSSRFWGCLKLVSPETGDGFELALYLRLFLGRWKFGRRPIRLICGYSLQIAPIVIAPITRRQRPCRRFSKLEPYQWYALEDVLVAHYGAYLLEHDLSLHSAQGEKEKLLASLDNSDVIADKADILVSRASGARRELAGLINVKASLLSVVLTMFPLANN